MKRRNVTPSILIKELCSLRNYYSVAVLLMASGVLCKGFNEINDKGEEVGVIYKEPLVEIHGELEAFRQIKQMRNYAAFCRNHDISTHPIGINEQMEVVRPVWHVASVFLAGYDKIHYMTCREGPSQDNEEWIRGLKTKDLITNWYTNWLIT